MLDSSAAETPVDQSQSGASRPGQLRSAVHLSVPPEPRCSALISTRSGVCRRLRKDLCLPPAIRFAPHAVVVAIKVRAVSRIASMDRSGAGFARLCAVAEHAMRPCGLGAVTCRDEPLRRLHGARRRGCRGKRTMTMAAAILAVVVAAMPVEAAAMCMCESGSQHDGHTDGTGQDEGHDLGVGAGVEWSLQDQCQFETGFRKWRGGMYPLSLRGVPGLLQSCDFGHCYVRGMCRADTRSP